MKSIISLIMTAVLLLSALTACGRTNTRSRVEEARVTPETGVTATSRPAATAAPMPKNTDGGVIEDDRTEGALGKAMDDAGDAVGDVVGGVGNAVGNAVSGVGDAIGGAADGAERAMDGRDEGVTDDTGMNRR